MREFLKLMCTESKGHCGLWYTTTKNKKANSPAQGTGGPNYSGTGCAENCGRDASCFSSCQSVNNQTMLPPGVAPLGSGR